MDNFFDTLLNEYKYYLLNENIVFINSLKEQSEPKDFTVTKIAVTCKNYDVTTIDGIKAISNNDFEAMRILQKVATNHKRNGDLELAIECLQKSNEISDHIPPKATTPKLTEKQYLRIIKYTNEFLGSDFAEKKETQIKQQHPEFFDKRISNKKLIAENISNTRKSGEDLVQVFTNKSCSICGEYDKKIYSISGESKKYPKLPNEIKNQTHNCKNCIITVHTYFDGVNS